MDLEVEVERGAARVPRVADEPEHGAGLDLGAVHRNRRVRGEVRVVELVALGVDEPEPVPADLVPAHREDDAVGDREGGRAVRREDVVAVVPGRRAIRAEGVDERRGAPDREDVAALAQRRGDLRDRAVRGRDQRQVVGRLRRDAADVGLGGGARSGDLGARLGPADEDLASGREPAVVAREMDVERGDKAAVAAASERCPARAGARSPSRRGRCAGSRSARRRARRAPRARRSRCRPHRPAPSSARRRRARAPRPSARRSRRRRATEPRRRRRPRRTGRAEPAAAEVLALSRAARDGRAVCGVLEARRGEDASGGAETSPTVTAAWPGSTTFTPNALDAAPPARPPAGDALPATKSRASTANADTARLRARREYAAALAG